MDKRTLITAAGISAVLLGGVAITAIGITQDLSGKSDWYVYNKGMGMCLRGSPTEWANMLEVADHVKPHVTYQTGNVHTALVTSPGSHLTVVFSDSLEFCEWFGKVMHAAE